MQLYKYKDSTINNLNGAEQFAEDYNKAKELIDKGDVECPCTVR